MSSTYIGIDFGTTKTLVSVYNERKQEAKIIRLGGGRDDIPTSVYVVEDDSFLCGEEAEDQSAADPKRYVRAFKMKLGSQDAALLYFEGTEIKQMTAAELTRAFLSYVRKECEAYINKKINRAVITRPVRFSPRQIKQLEEAAHGAGFEELAFITEPEAAAHTYCRHQSDDPFNNALIIDWGGGTLDMALVSRKDGQIKTYTKYTDGITKGGEDFDEALYHLVHARYVDDPGASTRLEGDMMEPEFNYSIRKTLRKSKEILSRIQQQTVRLSGSQGTYPAVKVQREEFEEAILSDIETAANLACSLIKSISEPSLKPDKLILVGGSSRIPAVAQILQERTGLPCRTWDMSVEAVGLGAALVAAERWSQPAETETDDTIEQASQMEELSPNPETAPASIPEPAPESCAAEAVDGSLYKQGLAYLHGIEVKEDDKVAAELFEKAHNAGDKNASYMLCHCYAAGIGVPRDEEKVFLLAEQLVEKGFYPALYFLYHAYRFGRGAELDHRKAKEYSGQLKKQCYQPIDGVDEILRYDALLNYYVGRPEPDLRKIESLARANIEVSCLPQRYFWLAQCLALSVFKGDTSPSLIRDLRDTLGAGIKENDTGCLWIMGLLRNRETRAYPEDKAEALKYIRQAVQSPNASSEIVFSMIQTLFDQSTSGEEVQKMLQLLWEKCNYGVSGIPGENRLQCLIKLEVNKTGRIWKAAPKDRLEAYINANKDLDGTFFCDVPPYLCIENKGKRMMRNFTLRICSAAAKLDKIITINQALNAGESCIVNLLHYDLPVRDDLYVEVSYEGQKATMVFNNVADFYHTAPPLILFWESGFFGGIVLKMVSVGDVVNNVDVYKAGGAHMDKPVNVASEPVNCGWAEFSDTTGLQMKETFTVCAEGFGNIEAQIVSSEKDPFRTSDTPITLSGPSSSNSSASNSSMILKTGKGEVLSIYRELNSFGQYNLIVKCLCKSVTGVKITKTNGEFAYKPALQVGETGTFSYLAFNDQKCIGESEKILFECDKFEPRWINMRELPIN